MKYKPSIDEFSTGYFIFSDARVVEFAGDYPVIASDTFEYVNQLVPRPLLKIGNSHYWPRPEKTVPPDVVAIPEHDRANDSDEEVLVAKEGTCDDLVLSGTVQPPERASR